MEPFLQPLAPVVDGTTTRAMSGAFPLLRGLSFFQGIGDEDLAAVAALMRQVRYQPGDFVFRQGTPTDGMYVIEEGTVQMWMRVTDGRHDMPRLGRGNVVCESAIAETHGRHQNAECLTPVSAWVLDLPSFETLRQRAHPAAYAVLVSASRNLALTLRAAFRFFGERCDHPAEPEAPRPVDPLPPLRAWGPAEFPLLRVIPAFKGWTDAQLSELSGRTQWVELPRGHRLLGEGQPGGTVFLVVRGALEVSTLRASGKFRHGLRGPGHTVGHEAVADGGRELVDCTAREATTALVIPQAFLQGLVNDGSPLAGQMLTHLCACVAREFAGDCKHFVRVLAEMEISADAGLDELLTTRC